MTRCCMETFDEVIHHKRPPPPTPSPFFYADTLYSLPATLWVTTSGKLEPLKQLDPLGETRQVLRNKPTPKIGSSMNI